MEKKIPDPLTISVRGFKSLAGENQIEIRPLTILAGANSSGKTSIMQPFLLLKQTLEANYDPGTLMLDGPNVRFTSVDQMFSKLGGQPQASSFSVRISAGNDPDLELSFKKTQKEAPGLGLKLDFVRLFVDEKVGEITFDMPEGKFMSFLYERIDEALSKAGSEFGGLKSSVLRDRCFFSFVAKNNKGDIVVRGTAPPIRFITELLKGITHVPGIRGNPERTYAVAGIGEFFPGTFDKYVASVIDHWQSNEDERYDLLCKNLEYLGLTWKVKAKPVESTQIELSVGRLPKQRNDGEQDFVSIADVGFGVSQTLPVLVALQAAQPGQIVFLEQPELHLHPRPRHLLAHILAEAAKRGVRVVVETHSRLLLLGIQTLAAEGKLTPDQVIFHWFKRDENGATKIHSADLDETGAFGEWPEDFDETDLGADSAYLDAAGL